jgi:signal transduction histidine kinase/pSer/pThr/pTyr-binding forkhead associated (FHA) protein
MATRKLTVSGPKGSRDLSLNPQGTTLGRSPNCDVILDHDSVSRFHARIYQDPFGRWIVEDLKSHNGIFINGQRIEACAVVPGQKISISHFTLSLSEKSDQKMVPGARAQSITTVVEKELTEELVTHKADHDAVLSPTLVQHLNELSDRLLKLSSPSDLYSEACLCLAEMLNTLVAIVRLPCTSESLSVSPDILACNFGQRKMGAGSLWVSNLHLSKSVLEAIRSTNTLVMASSRVSSEQKLQLTVVDEHETHVVAAARVNDLGETVDALYIDILQDKSPKELFDFVAAIAREINFVQKNLFLTKLQEQEKMLRDINTQLREKDRIKDEYVSRLTHDIKGHLTAIQSCLHIAADKSTGPLNDKQSDFLLRSCRRTAQLGDFVKELLNLTQMRLSGKFETTSFSLPDTISGALNTVDRKAKDKSITLTSKVEPSVGQIVGNQFSISEMITNLLFNAIKYTPENKTVHIETKSCGDYLQIDVSDTGIGIPADELGSVFDEFFRASNARQTEKDGTGLGLSIVKQIVKRHGGEISAQSLQGRGTTFSVKLPKGNPIAEQS